MSESLPGAVLSLLRDRRALLWVCQSYDLRQGEKTHDYDLPWSQAMLRYRVEPNRIDRRIAEFYWEAVWLEGAASPLLSALREAARDAGAGARRVVVLSSPEDADAELSPEEFLPISVLPGELDSTVPQSARYGSAKARVRERTAWELTSRLERFRGRVLIVLGARTQSDLTRLFEFIEDTPIIDLKILLVWPPASPVPEPPAGSFVDFSVWRGTTEDFLALLAENGTPATTDIDRWSVRVRARVVDLPPREVTRILNRFVLLTDQTIRPKPTFTMENLLAFLKGDLEDWGAYASGLPIQRSYRTLAGSLPDETVAALRKVQEDSGTSSSFLIRLRAEPGAGVTTLLRHAAYVAAREGFPTLVLRPEQVAVDQEEISAFATALAEAALSAGVTRLPPLLIVLDVEHAQRGIAGASIVDALAAHGRPVVVLQALPYEAGASDAERRTDRSVHLPALRAGLQKREVEQCERTLSQLVERWRLPLEVPTNDQWLNYESASRWPMQGAGHQTSLFWVALRFFLTEGMARPAVEQVQQLLGSWITERASQIHDSAIRESLTYVAAMSTFMLPSPIWTVLRPALGGAYSANLSSELTKLEGVVVWDGPIKDLGEDVLRFVHPALAETFLGERVVSGSTADRIGVLAPVLTAMSPGSRADIWVAETLAQSVLAPSYEERPSTDWEWRLESFNLIPPSIRDQSKTVLHHWARCLYLSADRRNAPTLKLPQRRARLESSIEKLERAAKLPRRPGREEHPSHLYNTLGTALYRLALVFEESDQREKATESWARACEAFQRAIDFSGGINVEALLAFSRRLISHARDRGMRNEEIPKAEELTHALELLDYASNIANVSATPDPDLISQVEEYRSLALGLLAREWGDMHVESLIRSAEPELGYYCAARLALYTGDLDDDPRAGDRALAILEEAERAGIDLSPRSIRLQIQLLERMPIANRDFVSVRSSYQRLEARLPDETRPLDLFRHAVLCYQTGAYTEGAARFRRLRAQFRNSDIPSFRMIDVWRDADRPDIARLTQMRVERTITDWRAEGYLPEMRQSVPFRPRHFSPPPQRGEIVTCAVRFERNGPLAIPPRFVSSRSGESSQSA